MNKAELRELFDLVDKAYFDQTKAHPKKMVINLEIATCIDQIFTCGDPNGRTLWNWALVVDETQTAPVMPYGAKEFHIPDPTPLRLPRYDNDE